MRDILFRGKRTDTGTWIEGYYIYLHKTTYCCKVSEKLEEENEIHQIVFERMTDWNLPNQHLRADVDPATVCQYTGLTDKNGRRIYEKDIVRTKYGRLCGVSWFSSPSYAGWDLIPLGIADEAPDKYDLYSSENLEVIGNIYDNPESRDP